MKNLLLSTLLITAMLFSCKKDDESGTSASASGTINVTNYGYDGQNAGKFTSTAAGIVKVTAAGNTVTTITGIKDGGKESITIILLKDVTTTGGIKLGPAYTNGGITITKDYTNVSDQTLVYSTDKNAPNMQGGGEVNVTKIEGKTMEGTFYFVAHNSAGKEAYAEQGTFKGTIN